jgi:putative transposase
MSQKDDSTTPFSRRSLRLKDYDYSSPGCYFVTICTKGNTCFLGQIENGKMISSELGLMARQFLLDLPVHFPYIALDASVVMPNHVHAIISIGAVGAPHVVPGKAPTSAFSRTVPGSLSMVIQQYKSSLTRWCNKNGFSYFKWQSRFYEHVIRNDGDLNSIRKYIVENPRRWSEDDEYVP